MSPLALSFPTAGVFMDKVEDAGCGVCSLVHHLMAIRE